MALLLPGGFHPSLARRGGRRWQNAPIDALLSPREPRRAQRQAERRSACRRGGTRRSGCCRSLLLVLVVGGTYGDIACFFSKMAVVTVGGAYAVLAYVAQDAVETYRWLTSAEMLTGLGLAETTPGPLILVLQFVGFLAGFHAATGPNGMAGALLGSLSSPSGPPSRPASPSSSSARP